MREFICFSLIQTLALARAFPVDQQVKDLLRGDITAIVLGVILSVIGLSALTVSCLRWKSKDFLLLSFGLFSGLYGVRLLANRETIHLLFDAPPRLWLYLEAFITQVILIPLLLFAQAVYGRGWKSSLRGLLWIQTIYAVVAILVDSLYRTPHKAPEPVLLLGLLLATVLVLGRVFGYRPPRTFFDRSETRSLIIGSLILSLFVINEHLVGAQSVPWRWRVEPIGFFIFVCCLGYIAVRRFFTNAQQLLVVEEEMAAARRIQSAILPQQMPSIPGVRLAVRYVPMTSVAGDFYDFLPVDEKRLGILVADVSGHGVPAALIASMVKMALASQAANASDPAQVMFGLNQSFCRQPLHGQFITAGYLFLDLEQRTALYAGAGHPPLLLWRKASQTVYEFQENGLILGIRAHEKYSNIPLRLESGDRILLYTDGILEASNASEDFFGEKRFKEFIRNHAHLSADRFADGLLQDLSAWLGNEAGQAPEDDLTLVVVDVQI